MVIVDRETDIHDGIDQVDVDRLSQTKTQPIDDEAVGCSSPDPRAAVHSNSTNSKHRSSTNDKSNLVGGRGIDGVEKKKSDKLLKKSETSAKYNLENRNSLESLESRCSTSPTISENVTPGLSPPETPEISSSSSTGNESPLSDHEAPIVNLAGVSLKENRKQSILTAQKNATNDPQSHSHHEVDKNLGCNPKKPMKEIRYDDTVSGKTNHDRDDRNRRPSKISSKLSETRRSLSITKPLRLTEEPPFMFAGILASIVSSIFFSLSILCVKLLPRGDEFPEKAKLLSFRGLSLIILCGGSIIVTKSTFIVRRDELLVNILRSVFGVSGVYGLYFALKYISMGDATALVFSSPIWTSILSYFILGEPLHWIQVLALPGSIFGIIMIAHPSLIVDMEKYMPESAIHMREEIAETLKIPFNQNVSLLNATFSTANETGHPILLDFLPINATNLTHHEHFEQSMTVIGEIEASSSDSIQYGSHLDFENRWPGIVIALFTSFMVSFTYIVLKFRKTTPIQTTTFWLGVTTLILSLGLGSFIGFGQLPASSYEWFLIFSNGVCSWLGQFCLQWAFLYEEAGILSVVRTLDVAAVFALSALFLDEEILWTSICGAMIIALIVVSIIFNNWISSFSCCGGNKKQVLILDDDLEAGNKGENGNHVKTVKTIDNYGSKDGNRNSKYSAKRDT